MTSERHSKSAIYGLPVELLRKVFLSGIRGIYRRSTQDFSSFSLVLTQVCHLWREIAINTSALWRSLPALILSNDIDSAGITAQPRLELLKMFLDRSRMASDIDISVSGSLSGPRPSLDLLLENSHRWGHARFDPSSFQTDLLARLQDRLPQLHMLQLQCSAISQCDAFIFAPNLQFVDLSSRNIVHWIPLPYQQIRSLSISSPHIETIDRFFNHLNGSISLERVCLNTRFRSSSTSIITLPRLGHLQLEVYHGDDQIDVLRYLRVPALEKLVAVGYLKLDYVYEMLLGSRNPKGVRLPLTELYLDIHQPTPSDDTWLITEILELATSLKSLEMPIHPDLEIEEVLTVLASRSQRQCFEFVQALP